MNILTLERYPFTRKDTLTFQIDFDQVQYNEDGSVTVGDPDSSVCLNGNFLLDLLTKDYIEI